MQIINDKTRYVLRYTLGCYLLGGKPFTGIIGANCKTEMWCLFEEGHFIKYLDKLPATNPLGQALYD